MTILINAIRTPDGTYLESTHRHDYKNPMDSVTGEIYTVDGGKDYIRGSLNTTPPTYLHVYTDDPIELIRERCKWGRNYDKDMNPLPKTEYIYIKDLTDDHLNAIIDGNYTQGVYLDVMIREREYRRENNA